MVLRYFLVEIQIPEFTYARTTASAMLQKVQPGRLRGTGCESFDESNIKTCYIPRTGRMFMGKSTVFFSFSIISN